jgi:hypothetical protein
MIAEMIMVVNKSRELPLPLDRGNRASEPSWLHFLQGSISCPTVSGCRRRTLRASSALLDEKIEGVAITAPIIEGDEAGGRVDLSSIDFEKLATLFGQRPRTAAEKLREQTEAKAHEMAARNPTRVHLVEKLCSVR